MAASEAVAAATAIERSMPGLVDGPSGVAIRQNIRSFSMTRDFHFLPCRMPRRSVLRLLTAAVALLCGTAAASARYAVAAPTVQQSGTRAVPDSITDFAALVRNLSDSGGYFDTDNLISNELGYQQVIGAMDRLGVRGGAYIGVGPDQNFTYIARVRPRIAFLLDIRRDNMLQHLLFKSLFSRASNRAEFLALWTGRPVPANIASLSARSVTDLVTWIDATPATTASSQRAKEMVRDDVQRMGIALSARDIATIARFHDEFIADGLSLRFTSTGRAPQSYYPTLRQLILGHDASGRMRGYLASEDDFQFLKSMHRRNLMIPVTGDLAGPKSLAAIGRYLSANNARVSTLYVSNVEDYLLRDRSFGAYATSVRALPRDTNAVIIRSFFGGAYGLADASPEYYATQLLERMDRFVSDPTVNTVVRYRDLVARPHVPLRQAARSRDEILNSVPTDTRTNFGPGSRVLLDAHNAYPERGRWSERLDSALATGLPVAIEQDLYWAPSGEGSKYASVVAHDDDALDGAPTLKSYFFERIRPVMERALLEGKRETWPLITLNLDFKDNKPDHLAHVWSLLGEYESWLTTTTRSADPARAGALTLGPLLVLSGSDTAQRRRFHDEIAVGATLRVFGAIVPVKVEGTTKGQRFRRSIQMSPAEHIARPADNYARWVNFPWSVVEEGGQNSAKGWTAGDSTRLSSLVARAHEQQLWIRFYTLDGFKKSDDRGFTASYNFGNLDAARLRWRAVIAAGVDFVATDQYGAFAAELRRSASPPR